MLKLSMIGCGNVSKTMAYLWHQAGSIEIADVVNRSQTSADKSVAFIGAGRPLDSIDKIQTADIFAIGCGDDHIESCLDDLLQQNVINNDTVIFHFSGAKSSKILRKPKNCNAHCASLHPVKSFTNPSDDIRSFANTYCGLEGDQVARDVLQTLLESVGGHCFNVDTDKKMSYHAASVFACNYLVALQELSIKAFQYSGVERDLAVKILEPIVKQTTNNLFQYGTTNSLTGPIARGDHKLVGQQLNKLKEWDTDAAEIYRLLGKLAVKLSNDKGSSNKADLEKISTLFK